MPIEFEEFQLFTVAEVFKILRKNKTAGYQLLNSGELASILVGGERLITAEALRTYIATRPKQRPAETKRSAAMREVQRRRRGDVA